jgi:hypothetical protein
MPNTKHVYVYPWPCNPQNPPAPLIADHEAEKSANLYQIDALNNAAGLVDGQDYGLSIGPVTVRNHASKARCDKLAPPTYMLVEG